MTPEYRASAGLNWSSLKHVNESPAHFHARLHAGPPRTAAKDFGEAFHAALFEPAVFRARWGMARFDGRTREGRQERAQNVGRKMLSVADAGRVTSMADAVRSHRVARELLEGASVELPLFWGIDGVPCKGLLDVLTRDGRLVDLKTTVSTGPRFVADSWRYGYHGQLAWYEWGLNVVGKPPPDVLMIAVENQEPFDVTVFRPSATLMTEGHAWAKRLFDRFVECRAADAWPGRAPLAVVELDAPRWADVDDIDDELSTMIGEQA